MSKIIDIEIIDLRVSTSDTSGVRSVSQKAELFMCVNQNQH